MADTGERTITAGEALPPVMAGAPPAAAPAEPQDREDTTAAPPHPALATPGPQPPVQAVTPTLHTPMLPPHNPFDPPTLMRTRSRNTTKQASAAVDPLSSSSHPRSNGRGDDSQGSAEPVPATPTHERRARWTAAEDEELIACVRVSPPLTWVEIGERMSTGRGHAGCMMRWYSHVRKVAEENGVRRIEPAGEEKKVREGLKGSNAAKSAKGKEDDGGAGAGNPRRWSPADDEALLAAVAIHGKRWDLIVIEMTGVSVPPAIKEEPVEPVAAVEAQPDADAMQVDAEVIENVAEAPVVDTLVASAAIVEAGPSTDTDVVIPTVEAVETVVETPIVDPPIVEALVVDAPVVTEAGPSTDAAAADDSLLKPASPSSSTAPLPLVAPSSPSNLVPRTIRACRERWQKLVKGDATLAAKVGVTVPVPAKAATKGKAKAKGKLITRYSEEGSEGDGDGDGEHEREEEEVGQLLRRLRGERAERLLLGLGVESTAVGRDDTEGDVDAEGEDEEVYEEDDDEETLKRATVARPDVAGPSTAPASSLSRILSFAPPPLAAPSANSASWTPQDDNQLIALVRMKNPPLSWSEIGERMERRKGASECLKRWYGGVKGIAGDVVRIEPVSGGKRPTGVAAAASTSNGALDTTYLTDTVTTRSSRPAPPPSSSLVVPSLSSLALVVHPPIPFAANSVIRGRRTLSPTALLGTLFSPKGRVRKVHCCPAENCGAAFKRSEHLKRHYRAVHVGAKPFPCDWISCGKSFSRKDNLQQHMAMVHGSQQGEKRATPVRSAAAIATAAKKKRGPGKNSKATKAAAAKEEEDAGPGPRTTARTLAERRAAKIRPAVEEEEEDDDEEEEEEQEEEQEQEEEDDMSGDDYKATSEHPNSPPTADGTASKKRMSMRGDDNLQEAARKRARTNSGLGGGGFGAVGDVVAQLKAGDEAEEGAAGEESYERTRV